MRIGGLARTRPVIEHRIDQDLRAQRHFAAIARGDRQQRGMSAARAFAHDRDPRAIDAQFVGVIMQPAQCGVIVLDRALPAGFWGEAVVDRHDHAAQHCGRSLEIGHAGFCSARDIAAAMGVQDCRCLASRGRR